MRFVWHLHGDMFLIFSDVSSQICKNTVWFRGVEWKTKQAGPFACVDAFKKTLSDLKLLSLHINLRAERFKTPAAGAKRQQFVQNKKNKKCWQLNANVKTLHSFIRFHSSSMVKICPCLWKLCVWTAVKWLFRPQLKLKVDGWVSLCLPHLKFIVLKQRQNAVSQPS